MGVGIGNSVMTPEVVIRPISLGDPVNHRFPSGPAAIPTGRLLVFGSGNSVIVWAAAGRARPASASVAPARKSRPLSPKKFMTFFSFRAIQQKDVSFTTALPVVLRRHAIG